MPDRCPEEPPPELHADIVVIGAGAAGLWAARVAAAAGVAKVILLEKTHRTGTKVLASGGTKCNLTTTLPADDAARLFGGRGERFLRRAFRNLPPEAVRAWFHEHGVSTHEAPLEKVFPDSGKAVHVRNALAEQATRAGVETVVGAAVLGLDRRPGGRGWALPLGDGRVALAQRVIACPGGQSFPRTGTTGDGYAWFRDLGCEIVEPVPALVPLTSSDIEITSLTGIAVQDAVVRLMSAEGREIGRRARPILFTHRGVSGPGAMDLSEAVARAGVAGRAAVPMRLVVDLAPSLTREETRRRLIEAASAAGMPRVGRALPIDLPRRLWDEVARQSGLPAEEPRANGLDKATRHGLIEALKGFSISVDGTLGFDKAEVTAGGLALRQVDPGTMALRGHDGMFVCGEILDVAGPIGGLNFQAAFATAQFAGLAAAR